MDFMIRKALMEDAPAVGAFYDRVVFLLNERKINYPLWVYKEYPSEASAREMIREGAQYICLSDGEIICAFAYNTDPRGNYASVNWTKYVPEGSYMVLHAFAVDPDRKGQGIGSGVLRFCAEEAERQGIRAIRLDTVPTNLPAKRFYMKNGFSYVEDAGLDRGIPEIPVFSLFERYW